MPKSKNEFELEVRSIKEIRAVGDDGTFEGYITVWDTTDDYGSSFQRGSFKKTIAERGHRVKVLYNHEELIGHPISIAEDDYGVFVRAQINLDVQRAKDTHSHLKAKDLDSLSFGFRTIKDRIVNGVRQILELALYEFGPVMFEANENAMITDVRAKRILTMNAKTETRDSDYEETVRKNELQQKGYVLLDGLYETLWDIWWGADVAAEDVVGYMDEAISKFHAAYIEWVGEFIKEFWSTEERSAPGSNELSVAMAKHIGSNLSATAANTSFTAVELRSLAKGKHIGAFGKLKELPDEVRSAHQVIRAKAVESLCCELRAGLTEVEKRRISALLQPVKTEQLEPGLGDIVAQIEQLRKNY